MIEAGHGLQCSRGARNLFIDSIEASLKVYRIVSVPLILALALVLTLALVCGPSSGHIPMTHKNIPAPLISPLE